MTLTATSVSGTSARLHKTFDKVLQSPTEHQEPAPARQPCRPRPTSLPEPRTSDPGADAGLGCGTRRGGLPRRHCAVPGGCAPGATAGWRVTTSVPYWTPLGTGWNDSKPYPARSRSRRRPGPRPEPRVLRSRPRAGRARFDATGRLRRLHVHRRRHHERHGVPVDRSANRRCLHPELHGGLSRRGRLPLGRAGHPHHPDAVLHLEAARGAPELFVLVAKDPSFSNLVDYAFTQLPACAPRNLLRPTTYPDETTLYYWASCRPRTSTGAAPWATLSWPQRRTSRSARRRPGRLSPADGALMTVQPVFRSTCRGRPAFPLPGRTRRRCRTARGRDDRLDLVPPCTTHPADTTLYWRVLADGEI